MLVTLLLRKPWRILLRSDSFVPPYINGTLRAEAYFLSANTSSEKIMILSPTVQRRWQSEEEMLK